MAQVKDGINGHVRGRVGNVVFYTMYGKTIARSLPQTVKRKKPTLKQATQRQKMKLVQEMLQPLKELIKITFAPAVENNAPYHVAKSHNMLHAIKGDYPDQSIDWPNVRLSVGSVELPEVYEIKKEKEGWYFTWSGQQGKANDTLVVMAFTPEYKKVEYRLTGIRRSDKAYFWQVNHEAAKWHVWLAFRSMDETGISNSLYLGHF